MQRIQRHTAAGTLVHRPEIKVDGVALAIFQVAHQLVVTNFVTAFHEFFQFQASGLFRSEYAFLSETLTFTVNVMQGGTHRLLVRLPVKMHQHLPHRLLFGDARPETRLAQVHQQGVQLVTSAPVLQFVQRPAQRRFKQ